MAPRNDTGSEQDSICLLSQSETRIELQQESPKQRPNWKRRIPQGWRLSVAGGACLAFLVFLLNLATTLWVTFRKNDGSSEDPPNTLFNGDCNQARQLNTLIHLLINALSTVLLSTSNYAMQCMTAPTRDEVDKAHRARNWLDIGVLSTRNLNAISRKRVLLWAILGISSLPLHLL